MRAYDLLRTVAGKVMGAVFPTGGGPAKLLETSGPAVLATVLRDTAQPLDHFVVDAHLDAWASRLADPAGLGRALRDVAAMIIAMAQPQAAAHAQHPQAEDGLRGRAVDGRPLAELPPATRMLPPGSAGLIAWAADQLGGDSYAEVLAAVVNAVNGDAAEEPTAAPPKAVRIASTSSRPAPAQPNSRWKTTPTRTVRSRR